MCTPASLEELYDDILYAEEKMHGDFWRFWQLIRIFPEEWRQKNAESENRAVWVLALCGRQAIWYDEEEEQFVVTSYQRYGETGETYTSTYQLVDAIMALFSHIQCDGGLLA